MKTDEDLGKCAEAFVLLRSLVRLDGKAGESLLTKLISMQMSSNYRVIDEYGEITRDEGEERRKIKCIGVEFRVRESNRLDSLMAYAKEVHHPSEEYEAICALMRTEGVPMDATQHIPVRIVIDYAYRRTMHFQVGMATAEPIVCAQYDALHSPTATAERTRLLISDVRTENSQYCAHDEASGITIGMVKNIVSRGVRIDHVPLLKWHSYRGDGERDEIETLQLLFGIGKKTSQSAIRSLEFNAGLDRDDAAGIFSALQLTKTVERVRILMPPDKHHSSEWEWLAYSIFSRHAAHNLKEVDLDFQSFTFLPMDVIEAFQKALKMKSLEPPLFGIVARKNGRYVPGKVCAKKFQLYCPPEARPDDQWIMFDPRYTHDPVLFESAEPLNVRALYGLGTDEELIQVLLPGWGLAWVRQRDMLSTEADEDEIAALPAVRSIPHLILSGVQTESIRYAMEVLKILGTSVTSIELRCCKRAIQEREAEEDELGPFQVGPIDSYLRQIFGFCPNLARVVLPEAPVRSLKPFIDRAPKLRALEIEKQLGARTAQFLPLLAALNDSTSSLAQHMQTIRLSLSVRQSADLTAIVSFLSTLLKTN